jgi:hypothetical protein
MTDDTPMTVPAREGSPSFEYQHWEVGDSAEGSRIAKVEWDSYSGGFGSPSKDQCEANFRLILSAPELLEACKAALELLGNPDADGFSADKVESVLRSVIAKAKGQA